MFLDNLTRLLISTLYPFDLGVIPKRLRSASDRAKFYRLIEASLYGGISSAITRSLRDYLLPENSGVRKAFQDMEGHYVKTG